VGRRARAHSAEITMASRVYRPHPTPALIRAKARLALRARLPA